MQVSEVMSTNVRLTRPDQSVQEAARIMSEIDAGALPVADNDRLVGMITDRDIALRAVAMGLGPDTPVRDAMTPVTRYCYEDQDTVEIAENMAELQVRRLPVMNRQKRLVGIISLADLANFDEPESAGVAIKGVSEPTDGAASPNRLT